MCAEPGLSRYWGGGQHIMPDIITRLREQWEEEEMRRCSVKFCSQAFTIDLCMSASQWSGKEAMRGWGEPSCAGPRHVEEEVGSKEWWGQTPHTLNTTRWKRNWQPQINSTFQWIISSFGCSNPLPPSLSLSFTPLCIRPPCSCQSFLPSSNHQNF